MRENFDRLSLAPPPSRLTCDSNLVGGETNKFFSLLRSPLLVPLTLSDRRFIVLKGAVFHRLASLLIKAAFFFSRRAARSGDRPL